MLRFVGSLFLFTGKNTFALDEERSRWELQFREKHGEENLRRLPGKKLTFRELLDEVSIAPFIGDRRLTVVDGVPSFTKEQVQALPASLHPATILLFVDPSPDKRLSAVKELMTIADVREFRELRSAELLTWVQNEAKTRALGFDRALASRLIDLVGNDQRMLSAELEKLSLYPKRPLERSDLDLLCVPSAEREVWHLTTVLAEGTPEEALSYTLRLLQSGEDPFALWNMLLWFLKSLVAVKAAVDDGITSPGSIARECHMPFPTASALLSLAKRIDIPHLKRVHSKAVDADLSLKTGGYRATAESPQELASVIDELVAGIGSARLTGSRSA
jgi:DNA polymerase III delta subunit